jgi:hypothetical protein
VTTATSDPVAARNRVPDWMNVRREVTMLASIGLEMSPSDDSSATLFGTPPHRMRGGSLVNAEEAMALGPVLEGGSR